RPYRQVDGQSPAQVFRRKEQVRLLRRPFAPENLHATTAAEKELLRRISCRAKQIVVGGRFAKQRIELSAQGRQRGRPRRDRSIRRGQSVQNLFVAKHFLSDD